MKNFLRQELQDVQDGIQRSQEIPRSGIPKAAPREEWEALKYKNKQAYFCDSRVPIISSDPIKPVFRISACPAIASATAGEIRVFCGAEPVSKKYYREDYTQVKHGPV